MNKIQIMINNFKWILLKEDHHNQLHKIIIVEDQEASVKVIQTPGILTCNKIDQLLQLMQWEDLFISFRVCQVIFKKISKTPIELYLEECHYQKIEKMLVLPFHPHNQVLI